MSALKPGLYRWSFGGKSFDGIRDGDGNFTYLASDGRRCVRGPADLLMTNTTPLIVLDLGENLADKHTSLVAFLRSGGWWNISDQIAKQIKPARILEPGLWGVVEAGLRTYRTEPMVTYKWVRHDRFWVSKSFPTAADWDDLIDPTLIREGVTS